MISIQLQRQVQLNNQRLNLVFYVIYVGILAFTVYSFIIDQKFSDIIANTPDLKVSWARKGNIYIDSNVTYAEGCDVPDMWMETTRSRIPRYSQYGCRNICKEDEFWRDDCYDKASVGIIKSVFELRTKTCITSDDLGLDVMFPDQLGGGPSNGSASFERLHMIPASLLYHVKFEYQYRLQRTPSKSPLLFSLNSDIDTVGSENDTRTVVLDAKGRFWRMFKAGEELSLAIQDIVALADKGIYWTSLGMSNDDDPPPANDNPRFIQFPKMLYATGGVIKSKVECFNTDKDVADFAEQFELEQTWPVQAEWRDPLCFLRFEVVAKTLMEYNVEYLPGGRHFALSHQMMILATQGNSFHRAWDLTSILLNLTSAIVMLSLPTVIIRFLALNCLGELSKIYRNVIVQQFDITEQCGAVAVRLMANSVPFVRLADAVVDSGTSGISLRRLKERMMSALHMDGGMLDELEIDRMACFCFHQALQLSRQKKNPGFGIDLEDCSVKCCRSVDEWQDDSEVMDCNSFSTAMTRNETMQLDSIVQLFDANRKVPCVERLFTPRGLWAAVRGPGAAEASRNKRSSETVRAETYQTIEEVETRTRDERAENQNARDTLTLWLEREERIQARVQELDTQHERLKAQHETIVSEVRQLQNDTRQPDKTLQGSFSDRSQMETWKFEIGKDVRQLQESVRGDVGVASANAIAAFEHRLRAVEEVCAQGFKQARTLPPIPALGDSDSKDSSSAAIRFLASRVDEIESRFEISLSRSPAKVASTCAIPVKLGSGPGRIVQAEVLREESTNDSSGYSDDDHISVLEKCIQKRLVGVKIKEMEALNRVASLEKSCEDKFAALFSRYNRLEIPDPDLEMPPTTLDRFQTTPRPLPGHSQTTPRPWNASKTLSANNSPRTLTEPLRTEETGPDVPIGTLRPQGDQVPSWDAATSRRSGTHRDAATLNYQVPSWDAETSRRNQVPEPLFPSPRHCGEKIWEMPFCLGGGRTPRKRVPGELLVPSGAAVSVPKTPRAPAQTDSPQSSPRSSQRRTVATLGQQRHQTHSAASLGEGYQTSSARSQSPGSPERRQAVADQGYQAPPARYL